MQINDIEIITKVLQTAISPVVMISGIGLLVLSMTNRFARTTDRARSLAEKIKNADRETAEHLRIQVKILYKRSRILLYSISSALNSVFLISLLIIALFISFISAVNLHYIIIALFVFSLIFLVISMALFIYDMTLSLKAVEEELSPILKK
ncbi:MAG TPA: DUF2721 domain-containing protein [Pyrinomonadaceae bacterium]|nr:DUF2721 domain-containing protein [Pyrinomonadaceae bacterium]